MEATFSLVVLAIVATLSRAEAFGSCPPCGNMEVPYPLSIDTNCGHPDYKLYCNNNKLEFRSVGGTDHSVLSISQNSYKLIISPPAIGLSICYSSDISEGGLSIDESSPFNISKGNTVMLFNCSDNIRLSPLNCSANSLCRMFEELEEGSACRGTLCCTYLKDSSMTSHRIRVRIGGCSAYTSVVDMDPNKPPSLWNYGIELQWLPLHP